MSRAKSIFTASIFGAGVLLACAAVRAEPVLPTQADKEKTPAKEPKEEAKKPKQFPFADLEKLIPPGVLDPEQEKMIRQQLQQAREQLQQAREQIEKARQQVQPGGRVPGGRFSPFGQANRLGVALTPPGEALVAQLDLDKDQGLVLNNIQPDSAAGKAGLKNFDILLELGGKKVPSQPGDFVKTLNEFKTGDKVDAVVLRKGKRETIKDVTMAEVPPSAARPARPKIEIPEFKLPRRPNP